MAISGAALDEAVAYNKARGYTRAETRKIQQEVGEEPVDGLWGEATTRSVAAWQQREGLEVDGKLGPATFDAMSADWCEITTLDAEAVAAIMRPTTFNETSRHGVPAYARLNLDTEYRHMGYSYHVGLSVGAYQHTQENLHRPLRAWINTDPSGYHAFWGDDGLTLLEVLERKGSRKVRVAGDPGLRAACVVPVSHGPMAMAHDLWDEAGPWPALFRAAAEVEAWRRALDADAYRAYFLPAWDYAQRRGWTRQQDLAFLFDRAINAGPGYVDRKLWPLVRDRRPGDVLPMVEHLSTHHKERTMHCFDETAWWVRYAPGAAPELDQ